jgi:hypothetical protein
LIAALRPRHRQVACGSVYNHLESPMRRILAAATKLAFASLAPVHAQDAKPFTHAKAIDLVALPPPSLDNDSP